MRLPSPRYRRTLFAQLVQEGHQDEAVEHCNADAESLHRPRLILELALL